MRRLIVIGTVVGVILAISGLTVFAEKAPPEVYDITNSIVTEVGQDKVIVASVKAQNEEGKSLKDIQALDEKWKNTPGIDDYMNSLMNNECAKRIKAIQKANPFMAEIFVMDNQGANVCMTDKTSDYWQGDEAKFKRSFANGRGAVFIDEVEFDDSTQAYMSQVSIPVIDGGKIIGAITFGIDIDRLN